MRVKLKQALLLLAVGTLSFFVLACGSKIKEVENDTTQVSEIKEPVETVEPKEEEAKTEKQEEKQEEKVEKEQTAITYFEENSESFLTKETVYYNSERYELAIDEGVFVPARTLSAIDALIDDFESASGLSLLENTDLNIHVTYGITPYIEESTNTIYLNAEGILLRGGQGVALVHELADLLVKDEEKAIEITQSVIEKKTFYYDLDSFNHYKEVAGIKGQTITDLTGFDKVEVYLLMENGERFSIENFKYDGKIEFDYEDAMKLSKEKYGIELTEIIGNITAPKNTIIKPIERYETINQRIDVLTDEHLEFNYFYIKGLCIEGNPSNVNMGYYKLLLVDESLDKNSNEYLLQKAAREWQAEQLKDYKTHVDYDMPINIDGQIGFFDPDCDGIDECFISFDAYMDEASRLDHFIVIKIVDGQPQYYDYDKYKEELGELRIFDGYLCTNGYYYIDNSYRGGYDVYVYTEPNYGDIEYTLSHWTYTSDVEFYIENKAGERIYYNEDEMNIAENQLIPDEGKVEYRNYRLGSKFRYSLVNS